MTEHATQATAVLNDGGAGVTYDFSDAVVLVTGAARGMGRDIARRFAGFGTRRRIPEQVAAIEALAMIGGRDAAHAVSEMIERATVCDSRSDAPRRNRYGTKPYTGGE